MTKTHHRYTGNCTMYRIGHVLVASTGFKESGGFDLTTTSSVLEVGFVLSLLLGDADEFH